MPHPSPEMSELARRGGVSLILPAFDEAAHIAGAIGEAVCCFEARQCGYEIIVAADGDPAAPSSSELR